eukprot:15344041-Heterocapsa_arctica.AAC.1
MEEALEPFPDYLRDICCRPGISGIFMEPDAGIIADVPASNASTRLASPASSVVGDDSESDTAPWEAFDDECNWET